MFLPLNEKNDTMKQEKHGPWLQPLLVLPPNFLASLRWCLPEKLLNFSVAATVKYYMK
uniref:Uncharacterized protein n=1 Tax=Physcomitrium patens TaxID=3218 RepID=A0A2K1JRP0_PHYPA|nr:hypothetical protein PHYPA_016583 [Physcomitrium patens]